MQIQYTDQLFCSRSMFVYGATGSGKTRLVRSAMEGGMKVFVANTDSGMVSLRKVRCPFVNVFSIKAMLEFVQAVESGQMNQFNLICLDDASELSRIVLNELKPNHKNKLQAYGEMADMIRDWLIRLKNCAFPGFQLINGKLDKVQDHLTGSFHFGPMFEGKVLSNEIKYIYDEVYYLEAGQDPNQATPTNPSGFWNAFRTQRDNQFDCKSRADCLNLWEPANLPHIIQKITNG